jgi:hypothetical protein
MCVHFWAPLYAQVETSNEIQRGLVSFILHPTSLSSTHSSRSHLLPLEEKIQLRLYVSMAQSRTYNL